MATDFPHQNNGRTRRRMQGYLGSNGKSGPFIKNTQKCQEMGSKISTRLVADGPQLRRSLDDLETYQTLSIRSLHCDPYEHLHIRHSEQVKHGGNNAFLSRAILITLLSELKCASLSSQVAVYQPRSFSQLSSL